MAKTKKFDTSDIKARWIIETDSVRCNSGEDILVSNDKSTVTFLLQCAPNIQLSNAKDPFFSTITDWTLDNYSQTAISGTRLLLNDKGRILAFQPLYSGNKLLISTDDFHKKCKGGGQTVRTLTRDSTAKRIDLICENQVLNPSNVDKAPAFKNGETALQTWIASTIEKPVREKGTPTSIKYVDLLIEKNGKCSKIEYAYGFTEEWTKSAEQQFQKMPKWTPATLDGQKVRCTVRVKVVAD